MQAALAGATVVPSRRQGKGNVVRQMFADIDADLYIMADGDGTYDVEAAPKLIHGYRVFTRRFAKSFPAMSPGFEIETEMSVHASVLRLPVKEVGTAYGVRGEDSESKLSTFRDGFKILRMIATLMKETRPFIFFSYIAVALVGVSMFSAAPVLLEYFQTGLVERMPTWVLSMTMLLASMMVFMAGVILDSVARGRNEQKRIHYLSIAPSRGEQFINAPRLQERRSSLRKTQGSHQQRATSARKNG